MANGLRLQIQTLGALRVSASGEPVPLGGRSAERLLAFLAFHHDVPVFRAALAATLWPDSDESVARRWLRQGLWQLRRSLGALADRVDIHQDWVALRLQARDSLDLLILNDPSVAVQGDFLAGWSDEWVLEARRIASQQRLRALESAAFQAEEAGDWAQAVALAHRALELDGLREAMHRVLMRVHLRDGARRSALTQYQNLAAQLLELGVEAEYETQLLAQQAQVPAQIIPTHEAKRTAFIGRQSERATLRQAVGVTGQPVTWATAGSLGGRVVWVEGEAGIGKSRLVEEFAQEARRRGVAVFWGECAEAVGNPFQPLVDALNAGMDDIKTAWLRERLPRATVASLGHVLNRFQVLSTVPGVVADSALLEVMVQLASIGPTVLVLDDLQWADSATRRWLLSLGAQLSILPFSLVLIARPSEPDGSGLTFGQRLAATHPFVSLLLEPMSDLEASSLVAQVTDNADVLQSALVHGQGNPLMLLELARHRSTQQATAIGAIRFERQILERLAILDHTTRTLLERLSVMSVRLPLEALVAEDGSQVLHRVELLSKLGWLVSRQEAVEIAHDAIRAVIRGQLDDGNDLLPDLHAAALRVLSRVPEISPATLAYHAEASHQWGWAAQQRLEAARDALRLHAYDMTLEHAEAGLRLVDHEQDTRRDGTRREALLSVRLPALEALGRWSELVAACQHRITELQNPLKIVDLKALSVRALLRLGSLEEARVVALEALRIADTEPRAKPVALSAFGLVAFRSGDLAAALSARREAVALSQPLEAERRAEFEYLLANSLIEAGQLEEAKTLLAGVARAHRVGQPAAYADALARLGVIWTLAHHPGRAESAYRIAAERYRVAGKRPALAATLNNLAVLQRDLGRIKLALETHERALTMYRAMNDRTGETATRLNLAVLYAIELGDEGAVQQQLEAIDGLNPDRTRSSGDAMIVYARACLQADTRAAVGLIEQHLKLERPWTGADLSVRLLLARFMTALGELAPAREFLTQIELRTDSLELPDVWLVWAEWHVTAGEFAAALKVLNRLERDAATLPLHRQHLLRHRALLGLKRETPALEALEAARAAAGERLRGFSDEQRLWAMERALELRPIRDTWQRLGTRRAEVSLPVSSQRDGRGKSVRAQVRVQWTPWEYSDSLIQDAVQRRHHQLERLIAEAHRQGASPTLEALRTAVGASLATVKRDLARLRTEHAGTKDFK